MEPPLGIERAKLDGELRHVSDDVDDAVLMDALRALYRRVKVVHDFDIPYIAGYSRDGATIYIDRHMPLTMERRSTRSGSRLSSSPMRS